MKDCLEDISEKITISINPRTREIGQYKRLEAACPQMDKSLSLWLLPVLFDLIFFLFTFSKEAFGVIGY